MADLPRRRLRKKKEGPGSKRTSAAAEEEPQEGPEEGPREGREERAAPAACDEFCDDDLWKVVGLIDSGEDLLASRPRLTSVVSPSLASTSTLTQPSSASESQASPLSRTPASESQTPSQSPFSSTSSGKSFPKIFATFKKDTSETNLDSFHI